MKYKPFQYYCKKCFEQLNLDPSTINIFATAPCTTANCMACGVKAKNTNLIMFKYKK